MKQDRIHAVHVEDSIDNRRVVRTRDERMSRDLLWFAGIAFVVVVLLVAYGWPRAVLRDAGSTAGKLQREQERLREENRELKLEKATLEDLKRVESIAKGSLGLQPPDASKVIVVETPKNLPKDARTADKAQPGNAHQ